MLVRPSVYSSRGRVPAFETLYPDGQADRHPAEKSAVLNCEACRRVLVIDVLLALECAQLLGQQLVKESLHRREDLLALDIY